MAHDGGRENITVMWKDHVECHLQEFLVVHHSAYLYSMIEQ